MPLVHHDKFFERFSYPAGESHVRMKGPLPDRYDTILWEAFNWADVLDACIAHELLVSAGHHTNKFLMPYLPFGRHDRAMCLGDGQPLQQLITLVQSFVVTIDPHSEASKAIPYIHQELCVIEYVKILQELYNTLPVIVVPDAGARAKAQKWIRSGYDVIVCGKTRDKETGKLSGFKIHQNEQLISGRHLLIIDDICDGGGTFVGLAEQLRKHNPRSITLAVTHGLFTKGLNTLVGIDNVLTLDIYQKRVLTGMESVPNSYSTTVHFIDTSKLFNTWENGQ